MHLARVVSAVVISFASVAYADDDPPPRPPLVIAPTPPVPTPPPAPPSEFVWSVSFGLGNVDLDQTRSGCDGCSGSPVPALETYAAVGRRLTPTFAFGVQGQAQAKLVDGHTGDDARAVVLIGFLYGSLDVTPEIQIIAGAGYGTAEYEYSVQQDSLFGSSSVTMEDRIGNGPAMLGAARYRLSELSHFDLALELRATVVRLDNAGTTPGVSLDLVAGRF